MTEKHDRGTSAVSGAGTTPAQPTAEPAEGVQPRVKTNMVWASVSTVLFWPAAIPAIIYASRARAAYARGDVAVAQHAYTISRRWTIAATIYFGIGLVIVAGILIAQS